MNEKIFNQSKVVIADGMTAMLEVTTRPELREKIRMLKSEIPQIRDHRTMRIFLDNLALISETRVMSIIYGQIVDSVSSEYLKMENQK